MTMNGDMDYRKYLQLICERRYLFVSVFLLIMTAAAALNLYLPKQYEATCTVFIEKGAVNDMVKGIALDPGNDGNLKGLGYTIKSRKLFVKVLNNLKLLPNAQDFVKTEAILRNYQDNTSISLKDGDGLFTISFRHSNPVLARDFVNTLIRLYVEELAATRKEEKKGATRFLSEQIRTYKTKLEYAEQQLDSFKREKGSMLAETPAQLELEIEQLQQKLNEVLLKRNDLETVLQHLPRNIESPNQARLAALQKQLAEMRAKYTDRYPEVVELNEQIRAAKEQLRWGEPVPMREPAETAKLRSELRGNEELERRYRRAIEDKRALQKTLPAALTALEELERNKNSQKTLYEQFLTRYEQSEVSRQAEVQDLSSTFRIIDPAVLPIRPSTPDPQKILLLGFVFGVAAGLGTLLLLDFMDSSIRHPHALKALGLPVLAVIGKIETKGQQKAGRMKDFFFFILSTGYLVLVLAAFNF